MAEKLEESQLTSLRAAKWTRRIIMALCPIITLLVAYRALFNRKKYINKTAEKILSTDGYYHWIFESVYYVPKNFPYDIAKEDGYWRIRDKVGNLAIDKPISVGDEIVWNEEKLYIY